MIPNATRWIMRTAVVSVDEALCLTLYAFAYDTDKTAQVTHLKSAWRLYKKRVLEIGDEASKQQSLASYQSHPLMKYGEKKIKKEDPGYDTDKDIAEEPKEAAGPHVELRILQLK